MSGTGSVIAAERLKLATLPAVQLGVLGTVLTGVVTGGAWAASGHDPSATAAGLMAAVVPFVQCGSIVLDILVATQEYAGRQVSTTLTAVPHRLRLLAGKTVAALEVLTLTAALTTGAALAAGALVAARDPAGGLALGADPLRLAGGIVYLALIGLLGLAGGLLSRALAPALVGLLTLVLIASPVLGSVSEQARWLPDRAGGLLYSGLPDPVLSATGGGAVLLAWVTAALVVAGWRLVAQDS